VAIGYSDEHHGGETVNRPRVFCDWCEQPIQDAHDGNVFWYHDRPSDLYFNHKRCARYHDVHLREVRSGEGVVVLAEELPVFLSQLLANVGMEAIE